MVAMDHGGDVCSREVASTIIIDVEFNCGWEVKHIFLIRESDRSIVEADWFNAVTCLLHRSPPTRIARGRAGAVK